MRHSDGDKVRFMALADRLREARRIAGITQQQLADRVKVTKSAISQWERGETANIKLETFFAVAEALNVDAKWLALDVKSNRPEDHPLYKELWAVFKNLPSNVQDSAIPVLKALQAQVLPDNRYSHNKRFPAA